MAYSPSLVEYGRRGGRKRAALYSREWQVAMMRFLQERKHAKTKIRTLKAWLRARGLEHLIAR